MNLHNSIKYSKFKETNNILSYFGKFTQDNIYFICIYSNGYFLRNCKHSAIYFTDIFLKCSPLIIADEIFIFCMHCFLVFLQNKLHLCLFSPFGFCRWKSGKLKTEKKKWMKWNKSKWLNIVLGVKGQTNQRV